MIQNVDNETASDHATYSFSQRFDRYILNRQNDELTANKYNNKPKIKNMVLSNVTGTIVVAISLLGIDRRYRTFCTFDIFTRRTFSIGPRFF